MKSLLILLTSGFPFGRGESFLETEIKYLSKRFSRVIILPTKKIGSVNPRVIPDNCQVDLKILSKKSNESNFHRFFSKVTASLCFPLFYKELIQIFPNKIIPSAVSKLFNFSRDAVWTKKALNQILQSQEYSAKAGIIYSYWCTGMALGATYNKKDLPVVSRIHGGDLYEDLYSKNYIPFRKSTFARLNTLFPISKYGLNYLSRKYPEYKLKYKLSRLGIPVSSKTQARTDKFYVYNIVSCSSIDHNKRVDAIAIALQLFALANSERTIHWHHFGDGPLKEKVQHLLDQFPSNLTGELHGYVKNHFLLRWYEENPVHLFLNLSKSEGIPVSIMEAYSYGIPSIATNVGGTSELVSETNGWLLNSNFTNEEIFYTLEEAIKNVDLRVKKGIEAKKTCLTKFNSEKNYSQFVKIIESLSNSPNY